MADGTGSLDIRIPINNIPPGQHVITIDATDPNGEPVRYYQFIDIEDKTEISARQAVKPVLHSLDSYDTTSSNQFELYDNKIKDNNTNATTNNSRQEHDSTGTYSTKSMTLILVILISMSIIVLRYAKAKTRKNK